MVGVFVSVLFFAETPVTTHRRVRFYACSFFHVHTWPHGPNIYTQKPSPFVAQLRRGLPHGTWPFQSSQARCGHRPMEVSCHCARIFLSTELPDMCPRNRKRTSRVMSASVNRYCPRQHQAHVSVIATVKGLKPSLGSDVSESIQTTVDQRHRSEGHLVGHCQCVRPYWKCQNLPVCAGVNYFITNQLRVGYKR